MLSRLFDGLRDEEGFTGCEKTIKDFLRERLRQEMFAPLSGPPGHLRTIFGEATVVS